MEKQLWELLESTIEQAGFELVDLTVSNQKCPVLQVFIDRPTLEVIPGIGVKPGNGVNLDECVEVTKELSAILDVEDLFPSFYTLEVSSPGVNRPIRKQSDFERFSDFPVHVRTKTPLQFSEAFSPSKNFKGVLKSANEGSVRIEWNRETIEIAKTEIQFVRLNPDMDLWMSLAQEKQEENEKGE